jgi:uncharacterized protein YciI
MLLNRAWASQVLGSAVVLSTVAMRFVLWGRDCDNALEKRAPFREHHLVGLRQQQQDGLLITLGPTADSRQVFGIYEAESQEQVEALLHGDIYWREGIWVELAVYPWIQAL